MAACAQEIVVTQQDEIALVRIQRVRVRVRRDHREIARISLGERRVCGVGEVEIRAAVVDEIDALPAW